MRNETSTGPCVVASLLAASLVPAPALAQTFLDAPRRNQVRLSYRAGLNLSATFKDTAVPTQPADPGPAVAGVDHFYDDGYNRVDSSGNLNHETWFWGYLHPSQVPGDGFIYMHSASSAPAGAPTEDKRNPQNGLELSYHRELARTGRFLWGLELALNYSHLSIEAHNVPGGTVNLVTDAYALGSTIPPAPPYFGTYEGPVPGGPNRPVIGDVPTRTVAVSTATGRRELDANAFGFRLGPTLSLPLGHRWAFSVSGGLALVSLHSDFTYEESFSSSGAQPGLVRRGQSSESDWLVGGYVAGQLTYALSEAWSVFVGAQYQKTGTFTQTAGDKQVELDLRKSIFVTAGLGYSF